MPAVDSSKKKIYKRLLAQKEMGNAKKNDFVELKYTGYVNGKVFDSNIPDDLKKLNPEAKPDALIISIGHGMVVPGLDKALEHKEIGKEYEVHLEAKEGFGERKRELMKTIPLKIFAEKNISPKPGMVFTLDNMLARIVAVSGARVITDFNNPLAGKDIDYKFTIVREVKDEEEKCKVVFSLLLRFVPEFEIKDKVVIKGPKNLEVFVKVFSEKFKEMVGKELDFELKEEKKAEKDKKEHGYSHEEREHSHAEHKH
jgi:FKBP-type peptidyl-prolyl cis-trans isomerase SlyD